MLLRSTGAKAARRTLMKSTPGLTVIFYASFCHHVFLIGFVSLIRYSKKSINQVWRTSFGKEREEERENESETEKERETETEKEKERERKREKESERGGVV